ncbi:MAG: glycosyltransferase [Candidatus Staskawiczbacteria bacterium]|nr:glycosyltransferase [Candidatus Staskawiczbacteria bacterium]MBI3337220.1 glycosyltransferase [Candidatus Staskawiczbacteria bacterium]
MPKSEKITIAFFLPSLESGGTERNVVNLVNKIDREKYAVSLVLGMAEGDFVKDINNDIPIISLHTRRSIATFFKLIAYFKKNQPDIFISAFPRVNVICIVAKIFSRSKTKIIITEHSVFSLLPIIAKTFWRGMFARFFMPSICNYVYQKADAIICVSKGIADDILKTVNRSLKIEIIYNPVVTDNIYQLAKEPISHPWFSDLKIPIIIAVGRLVKCKNYPHLFEAFNLVLKSHPAHLVILGAGPKMKKLVDIAQKMDLSKNIAFLGFQKNPYKFMKRASVFVLSSLQEGFGNVIVEAMACGAPVVSTNCPTGPGEIIENGKNGILVSVDDPQKLADAILKILNDQNLAKKFSMEGQKRAEFFSIKRSVNEYEKTFQMLMN